MSSDFLVPPAKSGNSVRLKAKNIRELRMESLQLQRQNQEMEQKLNQLRQSMSREKEERGRSNPYHWISGQAGNQRQDKENIGKVSAGKIKLKVLQNPVSEPEKPSSRTANTLAAEKPKVKGKACGQCESKSALLKCLECGEDYCTACFTRFHQKGALKLHRTMPIQSLNPEPRKEHLTKRSGSLLDGTFNEEESAKYFNEALLEWRNEARNKSRQVEADDTGSLEVQTVLTAAAKPLQIEFKESSLSYMEKLMLKKHRRTPVSQISHNHLEELRYSPSISENGLDKCNDLTAEEMEAHENYVALFRAEEHVRNDMIHEPALKIVELDKDPEESLDESRNFVVTDTENNAWNNHQSLSESEVKLPVSDRISPRSPERACEKQRNVPLRSTSCVKEGVKSTCVKASHSQDSKSMKYKSFKDSQSSDPAFMVNVPQELQSTVVKQPNRIEYQGFTGFFMLDIDPVEVKAEHCLPQTPDITAADEKVTYTGNAEWRPKSSLSVCADDAVVQDIVAEARSQSSNPFIERSLSPRNFPHRGIASPSSSSYSSKSIHRISGSYSSSRPNSAAARPMSRAASEISEIESVDCTDREDYLFEAEHERETLAILEKEYHYLHSAIFAKYVNSIFFTCLLIKLCETICPIKVMSLVGTLY
ncbi:LOW QUALITY PROTEIN: zinc finger B-box domain-containing protein 1 [Bufo bufo]|uniref:LOW QUALITY PROTEIN: zinc finger B-box domain-containing protein 1 n=1 Tax=Bufo bufo TaxID=8384 RepID=UPI001ABDE490|nr:LOW QUALITY PROTEIN: zinc finger B-box domain-containing protein 1 [Bufo bufo]